MSTWTIFVKDLRLELRTGESVATMLIFAAVVILLFAFTLDAAPTRFRDVLPGLMWMTYLFTAVLGLLRSFGHEKELDAYALLLSAPVDRSAIYLGKMTAFFLVLLAVQAISLPLFWLLLGVPVFAAPLALAAIFVATDLALAAVGTLVAGVSLRLPAGDTLLPILPFPLLTPLLIAATKATSAALEGQPLREWDFWLMLLLTFFALFVLVGTVIFDYISEQ